MKDILDDQILKETAQWFQNNKKTNNQMEYIKRQFKQYQNQMKVYAGKNNLSDKDRELIG